MFQRLFTGEEMRKWQDEEPFKVVHGWRDEESYDVLHKKVKNPLRFFAAECRLENP